MTGRVSEEGMRKAKRALSAFRSMQPILNAYARMLTGKPTIQVVEAAHDNGSTDGNKIYYRPPIGLGDELAHQRWLCDKRDDEGLQTCPSCAQREEILVTIYHEIAHIWFKSFEEVNEDRKAEALRDTVRLHGSKYAAAVADVIRSAPWSVTRDYMGLAGLISPFLPKIINALEDARVNSELFRAMPGTRQMFDADTRNIFKGGVEQVDKHGNWANKQWREYPLNAQVICGLFCKASGYSYAEWFHPEVVAALDDPELTTIVEKNTWLSSMGEVFGLSFPVLVRLRELGFCKLETDPEVEEEEEPEEEEPPPPPPPPPAPDSEPEPEEQDPEDGGEDQDEEPESGPSGEDETDDEEQGENDAEPKSGESDGTGTEEPDPEASGGGGEDQQEEGDQDPSGGEPAGEGDPGDERDSAPSESEAGESGDVDEHAEGSSSDDQETQGSSGSPGEDDDSGERPGDDSPGDGGTDPSGDEDLGDDVPGSPEGGSGDPSPASGDDTGSSTEPSPEAGGSDAPGGDPLGDDHDDLGGSEGLDPTRGSDLQSDGESDSDTLGADSSGGEADGERDAVLDTGPFTTGTRLVGDETTEPDEPRPEMGTPEECEPLLIKLGDHEPPGEAHVHQADDDAETMRTAIIQGMWFETPSSNIMGVHHYDFPPELYDRRPHQFDDGELERLTGEGWYYGWARTNPGDYAYIGVDPEEGESFDPPEQVVASALLKARLAFSDNLRGKHINNLKSGKVNGRSLGKRAPVGDDRVMRKKLKPSKKSYFVLIGIDISYSTIGENLSLAKKLAMAECEMLGRLGVKFAVYAHSASRLSEIESETGLSGMHMTVYRVKEPDEPWNDQTRHKLKSLGADTANLDGHQFEYYRRILDRRPETTKILHYYTDGAMPAENKDEELIVLQRELKTIKRKAYVVLGVGIRTDSPKQHGLETVELHEVGDITKVIAHLERELTRR